MNTTTDLIAATLTAPAPRGESRQQRRELAERSHEHAVARVVALESVCPDRPRTQADTQRFLQLYAARVDAERTARELKFV